MPQRSFRTLLWTVALLGLCLDQVTKYGVFYWLSGGEGQTRSIFGTDEGGFRLIAQFDPDGAGGWRPHVNHGALFGFLRHWQGGANAGFAIISLLAAVAIIYWSTQEATARDPWLCAALGLILAGTLGNLYDRLVFQGVRDFLHWNYLFDWPVFNIADCCLVCGAGLLLFEAFGASRHHAKPGEDNGGSAQRMQAVAATAGKS